MPRQSDDEKKIRLQQKIAKYQQHLRRMKRREERQTESQRTHRLIVGGALAETHALKNPASEFARIYVQLLKEYARPEDRSLFAEVFHTLLPSHEADALLSETPSPLPAEIAAALEEAAE